MGASIGKRARWENEKTEVVANTLQFDEPEDRVETVENKLRELLREGTPFTVITSHGYYEDTVISSISTTRDAKSANASILMLEMVQIAVASTSTVDAPEPLELRGQRTHSAGAQSPVPVDPNSAEGREAESVLHSLTFGRGGG